MCVIYIYIFQHKIIAKLLCSKSISNEAGNVVSSLRLVHKMKRAANQVDWESNLCKLHLISLRFQHSSIAPYNEPGSGVGY